MSAPSKSKFLQLFERDKGRCVFCGLDLRADFDRFMMATEDHLVPSSKSGKSRDLDNLVLCCLVCNRFKANYVPEKPIDPIKQRQEYIRDVRGHIMKKRGERLREFMRVTHPEQTEYQ
jgi:CRISPR/Cas system Type II protein with McrA/HNH and RuvC-like nuclease domain